MHKLKRNILAARSCAKNYTDFIKKNAAVIKNLFSGMSGDADSTGDTTGSIGEWATEGIAFAEAVFDDGKDSTKWYRLLLGLADQGTLLDSASDEVLWHRATHKGTCGGGRLTKRSQAKVLAQNAGAILSSPTARQLNGIESEEDLERFHRKLKKAGMDGLKPIWSDFMHGFRTGESAFQGQGLSALNSGFRRALGVFGGGGRRQTTNTESASQAGGGLAIGAAVVVGLALLG